MVIFHSYVSLPEGIIHGVTPQVKSTQHTSHVFRRPHVKSVSNWGVLDLAGWPSPCDQFEDQVEIRDWLLVVTKIIQNPQ